MTQQESDLPIELAAPARRALVGAGYWRLEQLTKLSEADFVARAKRLTSSPFVSRASAERGENIRGYLQGGQR